MKKSVGSILSKTTHDQVDEKSIRQTDAVTSREALVKGPAAALPEIKDSSDISSVRIDDLCSALSVPQPSASCLGYVADDEHYHELWPDPEKPTLPPNQSISLVSLESLLTDREGIRINRLERLRLARTLASSILQLQSTPWLIDNMEKHKIMFCRQGSEIDIEKPRIIHSFKTNKTVNPTPSIITPPRSDLIAVKLALAVSAYFFLSFVFGERSRV